MRMIEIKALENGGHRNQTSNISTVPEGWAVIPDDMAIPSSYPFVNIKVKDGVVVSMTESTVPAFEVVEEPSLLDTIEAQVTYTAMMTDTLLEV